MDERQGAEEVPGSAEAYRRAAQAARTAGDREGALRLALMSLTSEAAGREEFATVARTASELGQQVLARTMGQVAEAGDTGAALAAAGLLLLEQHAYRAARATLRQALARDCCTAELPSALALAHARCQEPAKAVQVYRAFGTLHPAQRLHQHYCRLLCGQQHDLRRAAMELRQAQRADPALAASHALSLSLADFEAATNRLNLPRILPDALPHWHFVQFGSVLLSPLAGMLARHHEASPGPDALAWQLQAVAGYLWIAKLRPQRVVAADRDAWVLARALARRLGLPLDEQDPRPGGPTLLVAARAGAIPEAARERHADQLVFACSLDWRQPAPVCPDLVGTFSSTLALPWQAPRLRVTERGLERPGAEDWEGRLARGGRGDDSWLNPWRGLLAWLPGGTHTTPLRPRFVPESPVPAA